MFRVQNERKNKFTMTVQFEHDETRHKQDEKYHFQSNPYIMHILKKVHLKFKVAYLIFCMSPLTPSQNRQTKFTNAEYVKWVILLAVFVQHTSTVCFKIVISE